MNKFLQRLLILGAVALLLIVAALNANAATQQSAETPLRVIVGTSLIEDVVNDLTENRAQVLTLIAASSCPGHEDMKATDVIFAANAQLALTHAFQQRMPTVTELFKAADNQKLRAESLNLNGNWMSPPTQREATVVIANLLKQVKPEWAAQIGARETARLRKIDSAEATAVRRLAPLKGKLIIAAAPQLDFLQWAGLDVFQTYATATQLSPKEVVDLVRQSRDKAAIGVVDNLQSGADAGKSLADELKVAHVTLSNFPGSSDDAPDYFSLLNRNVSALLSLLKTTP
jgi:ABC-type Zn uptake system ZnuABC Zn-binding protein ZnuA